MMESFSNTNVPAEERLPKKEALDEANMMRAFLVKNGKTPEDFTKEDYDWASEKISEIKKLAAENPDGKTAARKIVAILGNVATVPGVVVAFVLEIAIGAMTVFSGGHIKSLDKGPMDLLFELNTDLKEAYSKTHEMELSDMKEAGHEFAKNQGKDKAA